MIKLITHTDVDGISNIVLLKLCNVKFDYIMKEVHELDNYFKELLYNDLDKYEVIYVTDLCLNEDIYAMIFNSQYKDKFKIFDHHKTHLFAENYNTTKIDITECGTSLFFNYLKNKYDINKDNIKEYIKHVKNLDLWTWEEQNDFIARDLNTLLSIYGKENYIKEMYKKLRKDKPFKFNNFERKYLKLQEDIITRYINKKIDEIIKVKYENYIFAFLFSSKYRNELSDYIGKYYKEYDFIVTVNMEGGIGLRSYKDNIDVSLIAKNLNGGGHKAASGAPITDITKYDMINKLFDGCEIVSEN